MAKRADRSMRDRFELPLAADGRAGIYVCGHSLGPLLRSARELVSEEVDAWSRLGVEGWFRAEDPWFTYPESLAEPTARLVGASPDEVVSMNSLTVNLHVLLTSFYRPAAGRDRILIEAGAFPSDRYAVVSHLQRHGIDPSAGLVVAEPRTGEETLRAEDLEALIASEGDRLAIVWLPGVQYVSGQVLDIERLTAAGRAVGARVGWDLAHAAGNIPLSLHDWQADFAAWCSYKYLNGGPGSIGQAFIHERWADDPSVVRSAGWWGNDPATRFDVAFDFEPRPGAASWQTSTPSLLSMAPLRASLALFDEVGLDELRARSMALTAHLQRLVDTIEGVETVTPRGAHERGAMLCLRVPHRSEEVQQRLVERGVVLDFRRPDIFRLALAPLYNTFEDADRFAAILAEIVEQLSD